MVCSDTHTYRQNDCFVFFLRIYCLDVIKTANLLNMLNVACSSKQLFFFPYQTVFFKNDNWRVYGVAHVLLLLLKAQLSWTLISELWDSIHYAGRPSLVRRRCPTSIFSETFQAGPIKIVFHNLCYFYTVFGRKLDLSATVGRGGGGRGGRAVFWTKARSTLALPSGTAEGHP